FAISDLRNEAFVGAEVLAQILALDEHVGAGGVMRPAREERPVFERLAIPFAGEIGPIGRVAVAPQRLSRDHFGRHGPPLEIGTIDGVVPAAFDLAPGRQEADEGLPEIVARAHDSDRRTEILWRVARALGTGEDDDAA